MSKKWHLRPKWLGLGLVCFGVAFSAGAFAKQYQQQAAIRALINQARDAWVAGDANALSQLFTPDGVLIVPGQRWQGQARIRQEVSRFAQQYADVKIDIQQIMVADNRAAVEWHYEDTEKATGKRNQADDAILIDFKDGRISRWREYFDTETPAGKP